MLIFACGNCEMEIIRVIITANPVIPKFLIASWQLIPYSISILMKKFILMLLSFSILLIVESIFAQGKNTFSLGIYPPILEINAEPPANIEADISIQNLSNSTQNLKIIFKSFRPAETADGTLRYINEDLPAGRQGIIEGSDALILERIKVYDQENPVEEISLDPFESRNVTLKIDLEDSSPNGDYYFSVIFLSIKIHSGKSSGSQIQGGIGTNIILSVGPADGRASGEIKEFSIPGFLSNGPVPITLLLQNNSDHYIVPSGRIIIKDMFGREAGKVNILPQYILINSSRFMIDSDQASESAELSEHLRKLSSNHAVLIWPKKFLFGLYTAHAHIKLSNNGPIFETKTRFVALPIYTLFAISFVAFVLIGIFLRVKRKI